MRSLPVWAVLLGDNASPAGSLVQVGEDLGLTQSRYKLVVNSRSAMSALFFPSLGSAVATWLYQVSCAAAVILCLWEISNARRQGALAGVFSAVAHLFGAGPPAQIFAAALMVPTLTAVRQAPSEEKDLFAGCLAGLVFSVNVGVFLTC